MHDPWHHACSVGSIRVDVFLSGSVVYLPTVIVLLILHPNFRSGSRDAESSVQRVALLSQKLYEERATVVPFFFVSSLRCKRTSPSVEESRLGRALSSFYVKTARGADSSPVSYAEAFGLNHVSPHPCPSRS